MRALIVPAAAAELAAVREWVARTSRRDPAFQAEGVEPSLAGDALERRAYQLAIVDLTRTDDAGPALVHQARARGLSLPFLLLTGEAGAELAAETPRVAAISCDTLTVETLSSAVDDLRPGAQAPPAPVAQPNDDPGRDLAPAMLWRTDAAGAFTAFTREWCRFTGRTELEEHDQGWLAGVHPEDRARWRRVYGTACRSGQSFSLDFRLRRADGEHRWVRSRGLPRRARDGRFDGYLGSTFEIDDLKAANEALAAEVEQLARANRDLEQLTYGAAHDLDEPLRTLENALRLLSRETPLVLEGAPAGELQHALQSAHRMRALVRDLLECALVGVSGSPLEPGDLSAPLDWALANLARRVQETGARVTREPMPVALCDPAQIARVFQNLIGNAIKFRGDGLPVVHVSAERAGDEVVLRVSDRGMGIDAAHHESIFEPFRRAHARAPVERGPEGSGSGIGLAVCKRIVDRHAGRIWVESEPGKGSTFAFTLSASA